MESGSLGYGVKGYMFKFFEKPLSKWIDDAEIRNHVAEIMSDVRAQDKILRFFWLTRHPELFPYLPKGEKPKAFKRNEELANGGLHAFALFHEQLNVERREYYVGLCKGLYGNAIALGKEIDVMPQEVDILRKVRENFEGIANVIFKICEEELNLNSRLLRI